MLVLGRKQSEETVIVTPQGERIVVQVVAIAADRVRIGFEAPMSFAIHRREVLAQIDAARADAREGKG